MVVIRGGDSDGIDILADFVEEFPVISVLLEFGEFLTELLLLAVERALVHVADRNQMATAVDGVTAVAVTFSAHPNARYIDAVVGA